MRQLVALALIATTCGSGADNVVILTVDADPPGISDIAQLVISASDGQRRAEVVIKDLKMLMLPPARTIGLSVPSGAPTVVVQVEAQNAMGRSFAFGEGTVAMAGKGSTLTVKLQPSTPPPRFSTGQTIPSATGGTRLKPVGWTPAVTDDGPPITIGLTDTKLNFECLWQVAADGAYRCLPEGYQGAIGYSDAQCRSAVLVASPSRCNMNADVPAFGTLFNFNTCPASRSVWRKGTLVTGTIYTRNAANACIATTPLRADQKGWAIEVMELSMTVAATPMPSGTGAVVPVFLEAEDGARQFFRWRSAAHRADCDVGLAANGKARCLPTPIATVGTYWVDASCSQPAARTQKSSCSGDGQFVSNVANGVCPAATSIFRAGAKQANAFQRDATNSCSPAMLSTSDIYPLGAEVMPDAMDTAGMGMLPGTQRLRPLTDTTAGGTVIRDQYWDAKLRIVCSATVGTNGRVFCLPRVTEPPRGFIENTCSGSQVFLRRTEDCDVAYGAMENGVCPVGKRVFLLSTQPLTAGFFSTETGRCEGFMPRGGVQAFAAAREVPPSEFVELKRFTP